MGILLFLLIGGIIGWGASQVLGRDEGLTMSIIIGIVGAFIGSFISKAITGTDQSFLALNLGNLVWAFIGALVFTALLNVFTRSHHHVS
jgi:uncharacterized membrane protein YeaQ/YmgE (transglycosylase-associated protein family)